MVIRRGDEGSRLASRGGAGRGKGVRNIALLSIGLAILTLGGLASTARAASPVKQRYMVMMDGASQVPPTTTQATGSVTMVVNANKMTVCARIKVTGLPLPTVFAHLHQGPVGTNGPIVAQFKPPIGMKPHSTTGSAHSCATGVNPSVIAGLLDNPSDYYVNIHTTDFPSGAIRGQLP